MHHEPSREANPFKPGVDGSAELSASAAKLVAAERALQRLIGDRLENPHAERALLQALNGESPPPAGVYRFLSSTTSSETVVCVLDTTGANGLLKYIFAETGDRTFIVAAPVSWTEYHRELLARVKAATGEDAQCSGGGFIRILRHGRFWLGGESTEFGAGDHARAERAFGELLK
jgi:hypothetical protein